MAVELRETACPENIPIPELMRQTGNLGAEVLQNIYQFASGLDTSIAEIEPVCAQLISQLEAGEEIQFTEPVNPNLDNLIVNLRQFLANLESLYPQTSIPIRYGDLASAGFSLGIMDKFLRDYQISWTDLLNLENGSIQEIEQMLGGRDCLPFRFLPFYKDLLVNQEPENIEKTAVYLASHSTPEAAFFVKDGRIFGLTTSRGTTYLFAGQIKKDFEICGVVDCQDTDPLPELGIVLDIDGIILPYTSENQVTIDPARIKILGEIYKNHPLVAIWTHGPNQGTAVTLLQEKGIEVDPVAGVGSHEPLSGFDEGKIEAIKLELLQKYEECGLLEEVEQYGQQVYGIPTAKELLDFLLLKTTVHGKNPALFALDHFGWRDFDPQKAGNFLHHGVLIDDDPDLIEGCLKHSLSSALRMPDWKKSDNPENDSFYSLPRLLAVIQKGLAKKAVKYHDLETPKTDQKENFAQFQEKTAIYFYYKWCLELGRMLKEKSTQPALKKDTLYLLRMIARDLGRLDESELWQRLG